MHQHVAFRSLLFPLFSRAAVQLNKEIWPFIIIIFNLPSVIYYYFLNDRWPNQLVARISGAHVSGGGCTASEFLRAIAVIISSCSHRASSDSTTRCEAELTS